jgi:hypothetical protein
MDGKINFTSSKSSKNNFNHFWKLKDWFDTQPKKIHEPILYFTLNFNDKMNYTRLVHFNIIKD